MEGLTEKQSKLLEELEKKVIENDDNSYDSEDSEDEESDNEKVEDEHLNTLSKKELITILAKLADQVTDDLDDVKVYMDKVEEYEHKVDKKRMRIELKCKLIQKIKTVMELKYPEKVKKNKKINIVSDDTKDKYKCDLKNCEGKLCVKNGCNNFHAECGDQQCGNGRCCGPTS